MGLLDGDGAEGVAGEIDGVGRATSERMALEGARVAVFDLDGLLERLLPGGS